MSSDYPSRSGSVTAESIGALTTSNLSDSAAQALGVAASGSSGDVSRADHVHALPTASQVGAVAVPTSGQTTFVGAVNKVLATIPITDDTLTTVEWKFWAKRTDTGALCYRRYEVSATATSGTAALVGSNTLVVQHNGFSPTSVSVSPSVGNIELTFRLDASGGTINYEYTITTKTF